MRSIALPHLDAEAVGVHADLDHIGEIGGELPVRSHFSASVAARDAGVNGGPAGDDLAHRQRVIRFLAGQFCEHPARRRHVRAAADHQHLINLFPGQAGIG